MTVQKIGLILVSICSLCIVLHADTLSVPYKIPILNGRVVDGAACWSILKYHIPTLKKSAEQLQLELGEGDTTKIALCIEKYGAEKKLKVTFVDSLVDWLVLKQHADDHQPALISMRVLTGYPMQYIYAGYLQDSSHIKVIDLRMGEHLYATYSQLQNGMMMPLSKMTILISVGATAIETGSNLVKSDRLGATLTSRFANHYSVVSDPGCHINSYRIVSLSGKTIASGTVSPQKSEVMIETLLNPGVYILQYSYHENNGLKQIEQRRCLLTE
jgi:hypothetical protein